MNCIIKWFKAEIKVLFLKNICRITDGNQIFIFIWNYFRLFKFFFKNHWFHFIIFAQTSLTIVFVSRTAMLLVRQSPRSEPSVRRFQPEGRHASSDLRTWRGLPALHLEEIQHGKRFQFIYKKNISKYVPIRNFLLHLNKNKIRQLLVEHCKKLEHVPFISFQLFWEKYVLIRHFCLTKTKQKFFIKQIKKLVISFQLFWENAFRSASFWAASPIRSLQKTSVDQEISPNRALQVK